VATLLYASFAPAGVNRFVFALFMGVAMSITAFPVLARILTDRGLTKTPLGTTALACAAVNDAMAWVLLAAVVGVTRAMPSGGVPGEFVIAFAIGAAIPSRSALARAMAGWPSAIVTIVLLPAFFALTGLRTQVELVSSLSGWMTCLTIILVATAGKLGGAALAGRLSGMSWRLAAQLGALMNTRGLMELIALGVGLDAGIISPALFTMMVVMAIVTTAMTSPLLDALGALSTSRRPARR
ncbi:MAG TPA: cation:proton antiporter, partial [Vicinamibacterales bacterium]|nr:cation:proton antiporter [Vicinamibacterales bacterium]